jgi:hypothetical protein
LSDADRTLLEDSLAVTAATLERVNATPDTDHRDRFVLKERP